MPVAEHKKDNEMEMETDFELPPDFTLLNAEQIWGNENGKGQLDVIKKYGILVAPTDLAVLLGGSVTSSGKRTSEGDLSCIAWTSSSSRNKDVRCLLDDGKEGWGGPDGRKISVRPALSASEVYKLNPSIYLDGEFRMAEYGEFPQTVADNETSDELEELFQSKKLSQTKKTYTFDDADLERYKDFEPKKYPEYELDGEKYIRIFGRPANVNSRLSTGKRIEYEKPYWVHVEPIEWLVDKSGWIVSKKCLFSGIQFDSRDLYDGNFSRTFLRIYLIGYFASEIKSDDRLKKKKEKDRALIEDWDKTWGTIHFDKDSDAEILKKAQKLLDKGVDIDMAVIQNYNRTPLMCAVTAGKEKFVDYLISKKANVNKTDSYGFTPLMVAAVKGVVEIVQKLLDAGASITKKRQGKTALDMAKKYGHDDIAKLLTAGTKKLSLLVKSRHKGR